jgi:predicted  nucleic acid-binding Zn-ribbon protein
VSIAESKAKSLEGRLVSRRKDVAASRNALAKLENQIAQWESDGLIEKAQASRTAIKQAKLDVMKRTRECDEMQVEYDSIMNPKAGPGAEGIRARRRELDLELQLEERTDAYNDRITELNDLAAAKDEEVKAAEQYYEQALMLLGEEVYRARVSDPALAVFYPKLDRLAG